ncbi:hypothetical protein [Leptolyngbya ohadii]|uniref:hypothetical protein n=1 Tax=Leptolyngbya ohadii TaxID=1962290 RepID=UPI000B59BFE2|nr:hypothetical protein [Leptolyngbya ohadii]
MSFQEPSIQKQPISVFVKAEYASKDARELLQEPITALIGVNESTREALTSLNIHSIFDLATSKVFTAAKQIAEVSTPSADNLVAQYGFVPADWLNNGKATQSVDSLKLADIGILNGINDNREAIVNATHVQTIRDLSLYPPFRAAQTILNDAFNIQEFAPDPQAPPELLPKGGEYATEKVYYSSIFLDEIDSEPDLISIDEQVDLLSMDSTSGFQKPATGAILTFEQAWYTQGLALGQLLHSLALAPGESTKVAVIDWSRQQSSNLDENTDQQEGLSNQMDQSRGISQVTDAVAEEVSSGSSSTSSSSSASSHSFGANASAKLNKGIFSGSVSANYAGNLSNARTSGNSVSSSHGKRSVSSEMSQNINQSTQQISSSVRTRRASVVREVKQSEKETITTRVVTNYNHSHALSVHYYEVVQIYRTVLRLAKAQRCVFVPMKPLDFSDERLISRYREVLLAAEPDENTRKQIEAVSGNANFRWQVNVDNSSTISFDAEEQIESILINTFDQVQDRQLKKDDYYGQQLYNIYGSTIRFQGVNLEFEDSNERSVEWGQPIKNPPALGRLRKLKLKFEYNSNSQLDNEFENLRNQGLVDYDISEIRNTLNSSYSVDVRLELRLKNRNSRYSLTRKISVPIEVPSFRSNPEIGSISILESDPPVNSDDVRVKLNEKSTYYSQAIWQSLFPADIALLLSKYTFRGNRLLEYIDPVPLTTYGNYLVFPYNFDDENYNTNELKALSPEQQQDLNQWKAWKKKHVDFAKTEQSTVAIGTGGTFAEAVLGRFNASEKIDLTRFWKWEESPIPIQAPNIEGIRPGTRAIADNTTSGQLAPPAINLINPSPMPDPNFAAIQALATANLFRDASGLSNTVGLAQDLGKSTSAASSASVTAASKAAESAATQAPAPPKAGDAAKPGETAKPPGSDAPAVPANKPTEALKAAAEVSQAKLDNVVKLASLPTNVSLVGGLINASQNLEAVALASQALPPAPTTRERSNAVAEPTPTTRERSNAVAEPTPTTRERSNAVSEATPVERKRRNATADIASEDSKPTD